MIAKQNKRPISFNIKVEKNKIQGFDDRTEIWILVDNNEENYHYQWTVDKFM